MPHMTEPWGEQLNISPFLALDLLISRETDSANEAQYPNTFTQKHSIAPMVKTKTDAYVHTWKFIYTLMRVMPMTRKVS